MDIVWISLLIAAGIFLAGEFFIPVHPDAPNRKIQKHFWATTLSIIGLVLALLFTFLSRTDETLQELEREVKNLATPVNAMRAQGENLPIWDIFVGTERILAEEDDTGLLSNWVSETIKHLGADFSEGFIPIEDDRLPIDLPRLFERTSEFANTGRVLPSILATNVGSTDSYFQNWYINAHGSAFQERVPVVRFFLYSDDKSFKLTNTELRERIPLDQYLTEVQTIHQNTFAVFSAVIDVKHCVQVAEDPKDYLLINNQLLLESEVSTEWQIGHVRATGRETNIDAARDVLLQLWNCLDSNNARQHQFTLPKDVINIQFGDYLDALEIDKTSDDLAREFAALLIRGIEE